MGFPAAGLLLPGVLGKVGGKARREGGRDGLTGGVGSRLNVVNADLLLQEQNQLKGRNPELQPSLLWVLRICSALCMAFLLNPKGQDAAGCSPWGVNWGCIRECS